MCHRARVAQPRTVDAPGSWIGWEAGVSLPISWWADLLGGATARGAKMHWSRNHRKALCVVLVIAVHEYVFLYGLCDCIYATNLAPQDPAATGQSKLAVPPGVGSAAGLAEATPGGAELKEVAQGAHFAILYAKLHTRSVEQQPMDPNEAATIVYSIYPADVTRPDGSSFARLCADGITAQLQQNRDAFVVLRDLYHQNQCYGYPIFLWVEEDMVWCEGARQDLCNIVRWAQRPENFGTWDMIRAGLGMSGVFLKCSGLPGLLQALWERIDEPGIDWTVSSLYSDRTLTFRYNLWEHGRGLHASTIWDDDVNAMRSRSLAGCFEILAGSGLAPCCEFDVTNCEHKMLSPCEGSNIPRIDDADVMGDFFNPWRLAFTGAKAANVAKLKQRTKIVLSKPFGPENHCDATCASISNDTDIYVCEQASFLLAHTISELRNTEIHFNVSAQIPQGAHFLGDVAGLNLNIAIDRHELDCAEETFGHGCLQSSPHWSEKAGFVVNPHDATNKHSSCEALGVPGVSRLCPCVLEGAEVTTVVERCGPNYGQQVCGCAPNTTLVFCSAGGWCGGTAAHREVALVDFSCVHNVTN